MIMIFLNILKIAGIIILGFLVLGLIVNILGRFARFWIIEMSLATGIGVTVGLLSESTGWGIACGLLSIGVMEFCKKIIDE